MQKIKCPVYSQVTEVAGVLGEMDKEVGVSSLGQDGAEWDNAEVR